MSKKTIKSEPHRACQPASTIRPAVRRFLNEVSKAPSWKPGSGRLIFALDATMSRQPTWDMAVSVQGEMFDTLGGMNQLEVQLVYFRGMAECRHSAFVRSGRGLGTLMSKVSCRGGATQIGKIFTHTCREAVEAPVQALVFVGDSCEEVPDLLIRQAGLLRKHAVQGFFFQEGRDPSVQSVFQELASVTGGAFAQFKPGAASVLAGYLKAAATMAGAGRGALETLGRTSKEAQTLLSQLR